MNKRFFNLLLLIILFALSIFAIIRFSEPRDEHSIKVIHTVSYSNAVVFESISENPDRIVREFVPDPGKHVELLKSLDQSGPVVSVTPFANALIAISRNPELRIISGSGLNGISMIASDVQSIASLQDKNIGTSRGDSLELFAVELLEREGLQLDEFSLVYFSDPFEAIESIKSGEIDAVTHVEPFATNLVEDFSMNRVATSDSLWGDHPDAILLTTEDVIKKYESDIEWLINTLLETEAAILKDPTSTANNLASTFYQMPASKLLRILERQFPKINIKPYESFLKERYEVLRKLKYVNGPLRDDAFDWRFLP